QSEPRVARRQSIPPASTRKPDAKASGFQLNPSLRTGEIRFADEIASREPPKMSALIFGEPRRDEIRLRRVWGRI
ncbi:MAG: hypothetical protein IJR89_07220, partial [Clostridia bacterium]|nr:hypothetical protein [Clostridia bacterium]